MIEDARDVPSGTTIETEVCVIGGGAAGITLAREFIDAGFRVTLLESGADKPDEATQDLYSGDDVGRPYEIFPTSRFRYLGGTTNGWGGAWCDLPSPLDFEARDGVPHSGWPFSLSDLEPWYRRAQPILRLGEYGYSLSEWGIRPTDIPEPFKGPHIITRVLQQAPQNRFGETYRAELGEARNLTVYLNANALTLQTNESGTQVEEVEVGVLPNGRFTVRARIYVLSCGGIENARLLLLSDNGTGVGLGNQNDLVGRFFMLHLEYEGGTIHVDDPSVDLGFQTGEQGATYERSGTKRRYLTYVSLSDETRRRRDLPAVRFRFQYPRPPEMDILWDLRQRRVAREDLAHTLSKVIKKTPSMAAYTARRVIHGRIQPPTPPVDIPLRCTAEQMPNPNSRITLGDDVDAFGLRRVKVDWQLMDEDQRGIVEADTLMKDELTRSGFGKLESEVTAGEDGWPPGMRGDQHHIGTTRMHRDPKQGVVDEHCRVHGVDNVYVASCSLFPTGGTFNPTLTILALSLRVADHVKQRLA